MHIFYFIYLCIYVRVRACARRAARRRRIRHITEKTHIKDSFCNTRENNVFYLLLLLFTFCCFRHRSRVSLCFPHTPSMQRAKYKGWVLKKVQKRIWQDPESLYFYFFTFYLITLFTLFDLKKYQHYQQ